MKIKINYGISTYAKPNSNPYEIRKIIITYLKKI